MANVRLPIPTWMERWPRGIRPARIVIDDRRLALRYVHPERGFRDLALSVRAHGVEAHWQQGTLKDSAGLEQLRATVLARLGDSERKALGATIEAAQSPGAAACDGDAGRKRLVKALELVLSGENFSALSLVWEDLDAPATFQTLASQMAVALLLRLAGKPLAAISLCENAVPLARDADELSELGRLLASIGKFRDAADCFCTANTIAPCAALVAREMMCCAALGERDRARTAAESLWALAPTEREIDWAADALLEVGALDAYAALLERAFSRENRVAYLARLAQLRLFELRIADAKRLARSALELAADETARLVVGACQVLESRYEDAERTLRSLDSSEARLWRVRALLEQGKLVAAHELLLAEGDVTGSHPASHLWNTFIHTSRVRRWMPGRSKELLPTIMKRAARLPGADHVLHGANDFQAREVLKQLVGSQRVEAAYARGHSAVFEMLREAIADLGGNYSDTPTLVLGKRLERAPLETARRRAERLQRELLTSPLEKVLKRFQEDPEHRTNPFLITYRAEVLLWVGRYEEALDAFERTWADSRTRWGYIGRGAALARLGRYAQALEAWDEGRRYFGYLPQEATHAYHGEVMYALGQLDRALKSLRHATQVTPSRLGAQLALALAERAAGNSKASRAALDTAKALAPALVVNSLRSLGYEAEPMAADAGDLAHQCLVSLRGNRSSTLYTFFDTNGELSVIRSEPASVWQSVAEQLSGCRADLSAEPLLRVLEQT
ncbi:MAG: hypothetical protein H6718_26875 [Polyangiaceae bacterium]|nr:hypothetical protein [Polyangiaceae bacterium]